MVKRENEGDQQHRRRGRPLGKNRVPLSIEERRARNAQYERERRNDTAEAMSQLAECLSCDSNIPNADLLATAISRIQRASRKNTSEDIADLQRINANLESQIAALQSQLGIDDIELDWENDNSEHEQLSVSLRSERANDRLCEERTSKRQPKKRKRQSQTSERCERGKRIKMQSEASCSSASVPSPACDDSSPVRNCESVPNSVCDDPSPAYHCESSPSLGVDNSSPGHYSESSPNKMKCTTPTIPNQFLVGAQEKLNTIPEPQDAVQPELVFRPMYSSGSASTSRSIESIPASTGTPEIVPCTDNLSSPLIAAPYITSVIMDSPEYVLKHELEAGENLSIDSFNVNIGNECDILPRLDLTLDFLSENEKGMLNEWISSDFKDLDSQNNEVDFGNSNDSTLSGYFGPKSYNFFWHTPSESTP